MVRAAREQDLPRILTIYNVARRYMRAHGNTAQWVNGYPSEELLRQDLAAGQLYVLEDGGGVYAVFAFILGEDPTYRRIEGAWRDDSPYGTIHRLGSDGSHRGVFAETAAWAATQCGHLRADTHAANDTMQRCMERAGFVRCGAMQDEQGWSVSVCCMDCGAETAHAEYHTPEERLEAARRVAMLWNMGKVVHTGVGD